MVSKASLRIIGEYIGMIESSSLEHVVLCDRMVIFYYDDRSISMSYKTFYDIVDNMSLYRVSDVRKVKYGGR